MARTLCFDDRDRQPLFLGGSLTISCPSVAPRWGDCLLYPWMFDWIPDLDSEVLICHARRAACGKTTSGQTAGLMETLIPGISTKRPRTTLSSSTIHRNHLVFFTLRFTFAFPVFPQSYLEHFPSLCGHAFSITSGFYSVILVVGTWLNRRRNVSSPQGR